VKFSGRREIHSRIPESDGIAGSLNALRCELGFAVAVGSSIHPAHGQSQLKVPKE